MLEYFLFLHVFGNAFTYMNTLYRVVGCLQLWFLFMANMLAIWLRVKVIFAYTVSKFVMFVMVKNMTQQRILNVTTFYKSQMAISDITKSA